MSPAAVPTPDLSQLPQSLRAAGERQSAGDFAVGVLEALHGAGTANNSHIRGLAAGSVAKPLQALADAAHFLTILHGQVPSLFELAGRHEEMATASWLREAVAAFDDDRRWLTRLSVLTGGSLDLSGLTAAEQVVRDLRDAMLTLAKSSRAGCALGAAVTLVLDWHVLRDALPAAAQHLGFECRDLQADDWPLGGAGTALAEVGDDPKIRRAAAFGAMQLVSMHRQLFDLFEARHAVRLS